MNVKLSSQHKLLAGFWWNNRLEFNYYTIDIDMLTATADIVEQNVAFLRMRYIVEDTLSDIVFINQTEIDTIHDMKQAGIRVAILPEDPVDQVVGMILHTKLNLVGEDRIIIRGIRLQSIKGDGIVYEHNEVEFNPFFNQPGWWCTIDPEDTETIDSPSNITAITATRRWRDLGMTWSNDINVNSTDTGNVVVFGGSKKDED
jgi:hypothetical protein